MAPLMPMSAWLDSPLNRLVGKERAAGGPLMGPFALTMMYAPRPSPLNGLDSWLLPEAAALDVSYGEYLKEQRHQRCRPAFHQQ